MLPSQSFRIARKRQDQRIWEICEGIKLDHPVDSLRKFLDSYSLFTVGKSTPPTLMEIAGFQRWEKGYSNILAFLLDTGQAHCFGPLFVQAILAAYRDGCPRDWPGAEFEPDSVRETDKVEREERTKSGMYIDLLVECSELVICIENKIGSGLQNDLGEYRKHCKQLSDGRPVLGIVLSPYRLDHGQSEMYEHKFVNVTYSDFAEKLQRGSGNYIGRHNTQYQYLLFDFVEQARRFGGEKFMTEDQRDFLKLWRENDKEIANIQSMCTELRKELRAREKAQAHIEKCRLKLKSLNSSYDEVFESWIYAGHVAVFDLADNGHIDQCGIFLDVEFHPLRVSQVLGKRRGVEPAALASRLSKLSGVDFEQHKWADGQVSGRQAFHHENSPFEEEVLASAVEISVKILKALAELKLGTGGDAALK